MKTLKTRTKLIALVALVAIAAACAITRVRAQDTPPPIGERHALFGMTGITRGQTARINVSHLPPPVGDYPPGPTRVEMGFVDADGNPLLNNEGRPIHRVVMLEPGHSAFMQINANNLLVRDEVRLTFRPVVIVTPPPVNDRQLPPGPTVPTLEVIDNATSKTVLLSPGVIRGFNPQPDPPLGQ